MREQLIAIFWLCFALFGVYEGWVLDVGQARSPGPGFLPFWSAVLLGIFSVAHILVVTITKKRALGFRDLWKGVSWGKVIWASISLLVYAALFPRLGYILATFCLIFLVMIIMEPGRLWHHGLYAVMIAVVSFFIFNNLLDSRLPKGIFGF
jgi:hypothetical protein